ncbi:MAG: STAS domain-containing protein [Trebonia sp.]
MTTQVDLCESDGTTAVITISGELDAVASDGARDRLLSLIPRGGTVRVDLSGLTYISSAGLRTLLLAHRHAQEEGSRIRFAGIRDEVRFVMSATGFLSLFDIEDVAVR